MKFKLDPRRLPNETVLLVGVTYDRPDEMTGDTRGRTSPRVFTYAMLKASGLWYVTGSGQVPTAAGWGAIERWIGRDGRQVVWVDLITTRRRIWPPRVHTAEEIASGDVDTPPSRRRGTEWRQTTRTPEDDALGYHLD